MNVPYVKPVYMMFIKDNENQVVTDGTVGNKNPRFIINPKNLKGVMSAVMHPINQLLKMTVPTCSGKNT